MVFMHRSKWLCVAGSGVVLGLFNYFQSTDKIVNTAWTSNFQPSVKWDNDWDKRNYSSKIHSHGDVLDHSSQKKLSDHKTKFVPTARRHIFMIRHGQYNMAGKTDYEQSLTHLGEKQANLVGQRLKILQYNYTKLTRSSMTRAIETSDIIHKILPALPLDTCDLLREGVPIQPDPPSSTFTIDDEQCLRDGSRIEAAFRKHFHRADLTQTSDSYEIMVCHANVIRYFICRLLQFPPEAWLRFQLHHCSITHVVIVPSGRVGVYAIGDSGFIPQEDMTG